MSVFQRIFKVMQSEAHSAVDKFEDPIKLTEQGIRDLKTSLRQAMESLAQVKSTAIRLRKDADDQKRIASDYERKAMMLLQKMQSGDMDQAEAERLAGTALEKKEEAVTRATTLSTDQQTQQKMSDQLQAKVQKLQDQIRRYDTELITLRARSRTAESMKKINQQMAKVDSTSTVALLDKMKNKVMEQESLAQAYGEIADTSGGVDDEIEKALAEPSSAQTSDSLAELKKKMGITSGSTPG